MIIDKIKAYDGDMVFLTAAQWFALRVVLGESRTKDAQTALLDHPDRPRAVGGYGVIFGKILRPLMYWHDGCETLPVELKAHQECFDRPATFPDD